MSILDETHNFLRLHVYAAGDTEVPDEFHLWSCLSLIAACVGNNVWFEKFPGSKLFPNLYVILLGPSGLGKGKAIERVTKMAEQEQLISMYRGEMTKKRCIDLLAAPRKLKNEEDLQYLQGSRLYYVTPEMGMSLGTGVLAADFVKFMTEMFTADEGIHSEGTRQHGQRHVINPIINWLAGSTEDWLVQSVPPDAISGGFFARTIVVKEKYDLNNRKYIPMFPHDAEDVKKELRQRIYYMCRLRGIFSMTPAARRIDRDWYEGRPAPDDEMLIPIWKREHDIVYKLAMLLRISDMLFWDGDYTLEIDERQITGAQWLIGKVRRNLSDIIALASVTQDTKNRTLVMQKIKEHKKITRSKLLRMVSSRGVNGIILTAIIADLRDEKVISIKDDRGTAVYEWVRRGG